MKNLLILLLLRIRLWLKIVKAFFKTILTKYYFEHLIKEEEIERRISSIQDQSSILSEKKFLLDDEIEKNPMKIKEFLIYIDPKIVNFRGLNDIHLNYEEVLKKYFYIKLLLFIKFR